MIDTTPECATPAQLAELAQLDIKRLTEFFYQGAPIPTRRGYEILCQGTGPKVCVKQGYPVFKASYGIAQDALKAQIVPQLQQTKAILDLVFVYRVDSENPFGDFGQHHWRIVEVVP